MHSKAVLIFIFLLAPLIGNAGFYYKQNARRVCSGALVLSNPENDPGTFSNYTKESLTKDIQRDKTAISQKHLDAYSFAFGMLGLVAVAAMIVFWGSGVLAICVSATLAVLLGLAALGTGYIDAYNHHNTWMCGTGFTLGIVESLPVLLVGGLFFGAVEIMRFAFRRRHQGKKAES